MDGLSDENHLFKSALKKVMMFGSPDLDNSRIPVFQKSLEWDIQVDWLRKKLEDDAYAVKVYGALCNVQWQNVETNEIFTVSWRGAGDIVANNRRFNQSYLEYYCSGNEGEIDAEVAEDFAKLGWLAVKETPDVNEQAKQDLKDSAELINKINQE